MTKTGKTKKAWMMSVILMLILLLPQTVYAAEGISEDAGKMRIYRGRLDPAGQDNKHLV